MRLFDFNRTPNPRRVRIFLAEKRVQVPKVNVNLFRREQSSLGFRGYALPGPVSSPQIPEPIQRGRPCRPNLAVALW